MLVPLKLVRDKNDEITTIKKPMKEWSEDEKASWERAQARDEDFLIAKAIRDQQREAALMALKGKK